MTDLGQPLADPVPRPVPRRGRRQDRLGAVDDEAWLRTSSSRRSPSAAPRSSRRAAPRPPPRPPTRRSTTSATGCSARRTATGSRWAFPPTAPTASPRASSPASRHLRRRRVTIVQGLEIDDFSRARIDASVAELREERDAVRSSACLNDSAGCSPSAREMTPAAARLRLRCRPAVELHPPGT